MPPQRQQIFRMSRFEHMPSREIAEQLNLSVRTVDKHLELALKELRKYLNIIPAIIVFLDTCPEISPINLPAPLRSAGLSFVLYVVTGSIGPPIKRMKR